jgi:hypothetical protein
MPSIPFLDTTFSFPKAGNVVFGEAGCRSIQSSVAGAGVKCIRENGVKYAWVHGDECI